MKAGKLLLLGVALFGLPCSPNCHAQERAKRVFEGVGDAIGGTVRGIGDTVAGAGDAILGKKSPDEARREIDEETQKALNRLLSANSSARILNEQAYGYAAFDSRKFSFLLTTGMGAGVVVDRKTGKRTYMNMATGGAGLGVGMQFFQLIVLFEDKASLDKFVKLGWEGNAAASAVFGKNALEKNARFVEGMAVYQLNEAGIMADLNVTGTRYWKSRELNR
jgi:lipid-binding SYLF domain-containing protein